MSPASRIHGVIQFNIARLLWEAKQAANLPLQVMTEGAIIPSITAQDNVRVPDVVVAPSDDAKGDQVAADPVVIVEILSPGNSATTRENVRACATLASVQEIVMVQSVRMGAEVYRRSDAGPWLPDATIVEPGGRLEVRSVGMNCPLEAVYADSWMSRTAAQP